jgi:arylsulfatase A-like enzyme
VILVSIDTLRADHVGIYGYERDTTPFLDRWAKGATVFEHAYTTAAWTLVAHMTMLTGLFPEQHDVIGKRRALSPEIPLLAERLRAAGYRTLGLHGGGWIDERHGFQRGFDLFLLHEDLAEADRHLREVLDELDGEKPFFLFLHLFDVHCGPFTRESGNSVYPAPPPYDRMFAGAGRAPLPDIPAEQLWETPGLLEAEELATLVATYDGGIREVDDQLAAWFGELERRGLLRGALTIVTSDHGEALGQRGRLNKHGEYWQEGLHVPLIVRHPAGLRAGERVEEPVHLGDLVPTILATSGLAPDERLPGFSLFGPLPAERVIAGMKLPEAFVLKGREKLVAGPKDWCIALDLERDPHELAPAPGDLERFQALRSEANGPARFPRALMIERLSPEDEAVLRALGYGGDTEEDESKPR